MKEILERSVDSPQERIERTGEQNVEVPVRVAKEIHDDMMDFPQERMSERTGEENVEVRA